MDAVSPAQAYRQRRTADELYQRALDGPPFYAIGALIVGLLGARSAWHALLVGTAIGLFGLIGWQRIRHRPPADDAALTLWQRQHLWLVHPAGLTWSVLLIGVLLLDGPASMALVVAVLCTATYATGTVAQFAPVPRHALAAVGLLVGPAFVALTLNPESRALALLMAVHTTYLLIVLRRNARAFQAQLDLEEALRSSRAEVERLTLQDTLTGLANRRAYNLQMPQSWDQAHRRREPLALLMLDIDHFKRINDAHGHAAGDACLRHFAALLRSHFKRADDLPLRFGGEEFLVVLQDTPLADALEHAERFRHRVAGSPCEHEGRSIAFTVSIGVAAAHWDGQDDLEQLLERADAACYLSKHAGRNRVSRQTR
jgi:diguanylate cyclase (GGDEF)-like protein